MGEEPRIQPYTLYTGVYSGARCEEELRRTRPLSVRVARLVWKLYDELLTQEDKETLKYVIEGVIIALASRRAEQLPCEELLRRKEVLPSAPQRSHTTINLTININKAEARVEVDLEALAAALRELEETIERWREHRLLQKQQARILEDKIKEIKRRLGVN